ncbi:uncharacterized protein C8Q71DRAFT_854398 [Rhodofomes roseus]|uniref:Uncharacterized protein n=1 Tax=Rhodofomes roseus TaxID=34475 RepID=A0ABQ8KT68_9APHY|nr:uncharacterized protein C8Q71DRAFT_885597 [Rhodofomes roseus]XP_047783343.1 uncharacterized protein C8Q71DRAFT_854398 [Rhodofomes roseus]KAH9842033.1 hypothetical protein C8Q71DRAFT_885597 [Rhodofomes roseus]KAH9842044.1 hypothetical protein C8Q71DRAFT_854398 [Rhodofomes roseus]
MIEPDKPISIRVTDPHLPGLALERDEDVIRPGSHLLRYRHLRLLRETYGESQTIERPLNQAHIMPDTGSPQELFRTEVPPVLPSQGPRPPLFSKHVSPVRVLDDPSGRVLKSNDAASRVSPAPPVAHGAAEAPRQSMTVQFSPPVDGRSDQVPLVFAPSDLADTSRKVARASTSPPPEIRSIPTINLGTLHGTTAHKAVVPSLQYTPIRANTTPVRVTREASASYTTGAPPGITGPFRHEHAIRSRSEKIVWYMSTGPVLPGVPIAATIADAGDLYIHLNDGELQVWLRGKAAEWVPILERHPHPTINGYVLRLLDNGEPRWPDILLAIARHTLDPIELYKLDEQYRSSANTSPPADLSDPLSASTAETTREFITRYYPSFSALISPLSTYFRILLALASAAPTPPTPSSPAPPLARPRRFESVARASIPTSRPRPCLTCPQSGPRRTPTASRRCPASTASAAARARLPQRASSRCRATLPQSRMDGIIAVTMSLIWPDDFNLKATHTNNAPKTSYILCVRVVRVRTLGRSPSPLRLIVPRSALCGATGASLAGDDGGISTGAARWTVSTRDSETVLRTYDLCLTIAVPKEQDDQPMSSTPSTTFTLLIPRCAFFDELRASSSEDITGLERGKPSSSSDALKHLLSITTEDAKLKPRLPSIKINTPVSLRKSLRSPIANFNLRSPTVRKSAPAASLPPGAHKKRFRATVHRVMALRRASTTMTSGRIGAEPGIDPPPRERKSARMHTMVTAANSASLRSWTIP